MVLFFLFRVNTQAQLAQSLADAQQVHSWLLSTFRSLNQIGDSVALCLGSFFIDWFKLLHLSSGGECLRKSDEPPASSSSTSDFATRVSPCSGSMHNWIILSFLFFVYNLENWLCLILLDFVCFHRESRISLVVGLKLWNCILDVNGRHASPSAHRFTPPTG